MGGSEDPMLNYREFFNLKNQDDTDFISALFVGEQNIVIIDQIIFNFSKIGSWNK